MFLRCLSLTAAMLLALLQGCASVSGEPDLNTLVYLRTTDQPAPVELTGENSRAYAEWAVPFSRIASHVYCKSVSGSDAVKGTYVDCNTFPELSATGWVMLYDWQSVLSESEKMTGLEFMAFGRPAPGGVGDIIIGFRGTDFNGLSDWRANLRWVTRLLPLPGPDQYQVVHLHSRELIDLALAKAKEKIPAASGFFPRATRLAAGSHSCLPTATSA